MKRFKAGDASRAICEGCAAMVPTTFAYRDMPCDDGRGIIKGILVEVCNGCGTPAAIPAQSTPAIKRALEAFKLGCPSRKRA